MLCQDGPEVDVDLVFSEGQPVYGCLTDNWPTVEPYFNETGSNCPSILPMDQQKALIDLAVHSTQALGFTQVWTSFCPLLCKLVLKALFVSYWNLLDPGIPSRTCLAPASKQEVQKQT